jgi:hypothetical protein
MVGANFDATMTTQLATATLNIIKTANIIMSDFQYFRWGVM